MNADAQAVVDAVCMAFHVEPRTLFAASKSPRYSWPRMVAYYVLRARLGWQLKDIGTMFDRDHSTVHHGYRKVERRCRMVRADRELVDDIAVKVDELRAGNVADQASVSARATLMEAIERIDALVENALERRAQLVTAMSMIDPVITRGAA